MHVELTRPAYSGSVSMPIFAAALHISTWLISTSVRMFDGGQGRLPIGKSRRHIRPCRRAFAAAKDGALDCGGYRRNTHRVLDRPSFGDHQGKCAVEDVAGSESVDSGYMKSRKVLDDPVAVIKPVAAIFTGRNADESVREPLLQSPRRGGYVLCSCQTFSRRLRKDDVACRRRQSFDHPIRRDVAVKNGRFSGTTCREQNLSRKLRPTNVHQNGIEGADLLIGNGLRIFMKVAVVKWDNQPLAIVIDENRRNRGAGTLHAPHATGVDAVISQIGCDPRSGIVISNSTPKTCLSTKPGDRESGAGSHAFSDLQHLVG